MNPPVPFTLHHSYCIDSQYTTSSFTPSLLFLSLSLTPLPLSLLGSLVIDTYKLPGGEAIVCDPSLSPSHLH